MQDRMKYFIATLGLLVILAAAHAAPITSSGIPDQDHGYVEVHKKANMFWWLYGQENQDASARATQPLILWLQGGPGGSSCGFGNFGEVGPLDVNLQRRETTWAQYSNLLFVDQPVGTGYSYVELGGKFAKSESDIAEDMITLLSAFFDKYPDLLQAPFWIFSESYGGKMASSIGKAVFDAKQSGKLLSNFQGVALGDSWVSPIDAVSSYGNFLFQTSQVDIVHAQKLDGSAKKMQDMLSNKKFEEATMEWQAQQTLMESASGSVNVYNFLLHGNEDESNSLDPHPLFRGKPLTFGGQSLDDLMNGKLKKELGIPSHVTWGGQSSKVFEQLAGDFMQDVVSTVDYLLDNDVQVVIYNGALDVIVDTPGVHAWVQKLKWAGLQKFYESPREAQYFNETTQETQGFLRQYQNFRFWDVLNAGHMVPADNPLMAVKMMRSIIEN